MAVEGFGTGIAGVTSTSKTLALATGFSNLGQAIARRLSTEQGGLFYDTTYGYDVRSLLSSSTDQNAINIASSDIAQQIQLDERVTFASVNGTFSAQTRTMTLEIAVETDEGPFELVLVVNDLTVELLSAQAF